MKKIYLVLLIAMCSTTCFSQAVKKTPAQTPTVAKKTPYQEKVEEKLERLDTLVLACFRQLDAININTSLKQRYKIYPTENMYNLLRLDTKTGKIVQIQWSLEDSNEGYTTINSMDLTNGTSYGSGTFELYPTKNMYQFILLNKVDGRAWHVQWGLEYGKRWIRQIPMYL